MAEFIASNWSQLLVALLVGSCFFGVMTLFKYLE